MTTGKDYLEKLIRREDLTRNEAEGLMNAIMSGELNDVQIAGVLIALRAKEERGESYGREETTVESEGERYRMAFYLRHAGGGGEGDSITVERLSATILVKVK